MRTNNNGMDANERVSHPGYSSYISSAPFDGDGLGSPLVIPDIPSYARFARAADGWPIDAMNFRGGKSAHPLHANIQHQNHPKQKISLQAQRGKVLKNAG